MASNTPIGSNTTPLSPQLFKSKSIFLHEWWLVKPQRQSKGLAIGGVASMQRQRLFFSTVIAKRHEANVVETEDGITIIFRGFINASRTSQNGFPSEVCRHFLLGFPHDWKNYSAHSSKDECEHVNGDNGFDDSNASAHKTAAVTLPLSVPDNNEVMPPKKICNELGNSFGNGPKQSESTDNMECGINMECDINMTAMEAEGMDNMGSLKLSQPQVDVIYNGENGISGVAAVESGQSLMGVFDQSPCAELLGKSSVKSPVSTQKLNNDQLSSDRKKKQPIRQKIEEDTGNSCSRVVTRSISKRSNISNASSPKTADETLPFSVPDSNEVFLPPAEICNGMENSFGNGSKQSELTDNMECGVNNMTMEAEGKDNMGNVKLSRPRVDVIYNGDNGVSDVAAVEGGQSLMGMLDPNQLSSEREKKKRIRQKIVDDTGNSCSRVVTRNISKRSHMVVKKVGKVKVTCVSSPVRRSPRLLNCKK